MSFAKVRGLISLQVRAYSHKLVALTLLILGATAHSAPEFEPLGTIDGNNTYAMDVSADGSVVVGYFGTETISAFRWDESTGVHLLPRSADTEVGSFAFGVSGDGAVIVGTLTDDHNTHHAFRWHNKTGTVRLGTAENALTSIARAVSYSGRRTVGSAQFTLSDFAPLVWHGRSTHPVNIHRRNEIASVRLSGIDDSGTNASGTIFEQDGVPRAASWSDSSGLERLPLIDYQLSSTGSTVSRDGTTIVGTVMSSAGREAVRWVGPNRTPEILGDLPHGRLEAFPFGTSATGHVVVGRASSAIGDEAFMWDAASGMRSLRDVLLEAGVKELESWQLFRAVGVSSDGGIVVGTGRNPEGIVEPWRVHLNEMTPNP